MDVEKSQIRHDLDLEGTYKIMVDRNKPVVIVQCRKFYYKGRCMR